MVQQHDQMSKELAYYLTLFTLEGHKTWRAHLGGDKEAFDRQDAINVKNGAQPMKVTKRHVIRFDRLTGQLQPLPDQDEH